MSYELRVSSFDYNLPEKFIAQNPVEPRDSSRLMVINKKEKTLEHHHFFEILNYFQPGDLLVWNDSKVFKARLKGKIEMDDKVMDLKVKNSRPILNVPKVEIFLVRPMENLGVWKVLAKPAKKLRLGMRIRFADDFMAEVLFKEKDGTVLVQFADDDAVVRAKANKYGEVPVPPYIKNSSLYPSPKRGGARGGVLSEQYQTVYARAEGSVAAPTAGFHFTSELIEKLKAKGVQFAEVTLHVGLGTFLPVKTEKLADHKMHSEWVELTDKNAGLINQAKAEGRRVIAVGTTTVRTLEGIAELSLRGIRQTAETAVIPKSGVPTKLVHETRGLPRSSRGRDSLAMTLRPYAGDINLFITPGFEFKIVDALITNFHLPKSTLLMLVSAFAGDREFILNCYEEAKKKDYRFYSFGDAMLIV